MPLSCSSLLRRRPLTDVCIITEELFDAQDKAYKLSVFPDGAPVVSVEAYSVSRGLKRLPSTS